MDIETNHLLDRIASALEQLVAIQLSQGKPQSDQGSRMTEAELRDSCSKWARDNGLKDTRAVHAIRYAKIDSFDKVCKESLEGVPHCGEKTIQKILDWAESRQSSTNN